MSLLLLCSACSSASSAQSGTQSGTQTSGTSSDPIEIEIMGYFVTDVSPDDEIIQYLNEKFNVKIIPTFTKLDNYEETLNNRIASGDIPDWFRVRDELLYSQLVEDGLIINLSEAVEKYGLTNMQAQFEKPAAELLMKDGAFYRSPDSEGHLVPNFYIRQDWLEALNLETPTTWEEFKEMLEIFVAEDPDGNGNIGMTSFGDFQIDAYSSCWTGYAGWAYVDGELTYHKVDDQYKEYLKYWADLYASGLMDTEMYNNSWDDIMQKVASGRAGVLLMNMNQLWWDNNVKPLAEYMPSASIANLVPVPAGPAGSIVSQDVLYSADSVFSSQVPEEKQERMLTLMDYLLSDEGRELTIYGFEGKHHEVVDGEKVQLESVLTEWGQGQHVLGEIADFGSNDITAKSPEVLKWFEWQDTPGNIQHDYTTKFSDADAAAIKVSLDEVVDNWVAKFMTGQANIDDEWDDYIAEVNAAGYEDYKTMLEDYLQENEIELLTITR